MRFRGNFYRESFFNTSGDPQTSPVPGTEPGATPVVMPGVDPTNPTTVDPVSPIAEVQDEPAVDISTTAGVDEEVPTYTLEEIDDIIGTIAPSTQTYPYYVAHPTMPGYNILVTDGGGTLITTDDTPATVITGGWTGGGSGGGAIEEEIDEKIDETPKSKMNIVWLIVIAVGIYFGYKYFVKNK